MVTMLKHFLIPQFIISWRFPIFLKVTVTTSILLNLFINPSFAADPFRTQEPRKITRKLFLKRFSKKEITQRLKIPYKQLFLANPMNP